MPLAASSAPAGHDVAATLHQAVQAAEALLADAQRAVAQRVMNDGRAIARTFDREQRATHGLAWLATYVEALRQLAAYAERLAADGNFGEVEQLLVHIGAGEYLAQILGGIPMSQNEIVRLADLGLAPSAVAARVTPAVERLIAAGNTAPRRARLAELMRQRPEATVGTCGLDETLDAIREEMRKFADGEVVPHAQQWHLRNHYIPLDVIAQMSELGVFSLTIPEDYGGMGLGKESMCVVSEELPAAISASARSAPARRSPPSSSSAAAPRSRNANGCRRSPRARCCRRRCSPSRIPAPTLPRLKTRAVRHGDTYKVYGNKTWITHPVRADLMTLLVRTNQAEKGYRGLSMLLAEKPRGTDADPFPARGMSGTEIEVLGYRGMKEYEIAFDGFAVKAENLLGGVEGLGFKQLMATFESARIQTAARAVGVAQAALEEALGYATTRVQFGEPIANFPRVADKLALMAAEIMIARQLTYYAARQKDSGRRCDLEAGMAKLLAARVAWAAADNAVQIHGGNGFALEFPVSRILCDARILNIFEGAAEIQANVIARRLLDGSN